MKKNYILYKINDSMLATHSYMLLPIHLLILVKIYVDHTSFK